MEKSERTKAIVLGIIVTLMIVVLPPLADTYQHNYSQVCEVYEVTDEYTTFIDPCGYLWDVTDTDYVEGEIVKVSFFDNFTDFDRTDDEITKVKRVK